MDVEGSGGGMEGRVASWRKGRSGEGRSGGSVGSGVEGIEGREGWREEC